VLPHSQRQTHMPSSSSPIRTPLRIPHQNTPPELLSDFLICLMKLLSVSLTRSNTRTLIPGPEIHFRSPQPRTPVENRGASLPQVRPLELYTELRAATQASPCNSFETPTSFSNIVSAHLPRIETKPWRVLASTYSKTQLLSDANPTDAY
jgi:hypothetical protein